MSSDSRRLCFSVLLCLALLPSASRARVFLNQQQALRAAFPEADRIQKKTYVLTARQSEEIRRSARTPLPSRIVTLHTAWRGDQLLGRAHIDVHGVRTKSEALLVVLDASGEVRSVQVLAFYEPIDYLPTQRWYDQFVGKRRGDDLRLARDVHAVAGATLSARAATASVRRMLAYHRVLLAAAAPRAAGPTRKLGGR